jgi:hypothetical protein
MVLAALQADGIGDFVLLPWALAVVVIEKLHALGHGNSDEGKDIGGEGGWE